MPANEGWHTALLLQQTTQPEICTQIRRVNENKVRMCVCMEWEWGQKKKRGWKINHDNGTRVSTNFHKIYFNLIYATFVYAMFRTEMTWRTISIWIICRGRNDSFFVEFLPKFERMFLLHSKLLLAQIEASFKFDVISWTIAEKTIRFDNFLCSILNDLSLDAFTISNTIFRLSANADKVRKPRIGRICRTYDEKMVQNVKKSFFRSFYLIRIISFFNWVQFD